MIDDTSKRERLFASLLAVVELVLFGIALFFLIPPIPSNVADPSDAAFPRALAIVAFALGRTMAVLRKKRSITYSVAEVAIFWAFSWILLLRLQT